jgi:hypothetical protein
MFEFLCSELLLSPSQFRHTLDPFFEMLGPILTSFILFLLDLGLEVFPPFHLLLLHLLILHPNFDLLVTLLLLLEMVLDLELQLIFE